MNKPVNSHNRSFSSTCKWFTVLATVAIMTGCLETGTAFASPEDSPAIFENFKLAPEFSPDPYTVRGISGGNTEAREVANREETPTGPCVGYVDRQPDHRITLASFFNYMSVQVEAINDNAQEPTDTTLVISGPGGSWCNDDANGKNPEITGQWQEGTYGVWVGSYKKDTYHRYMLRVTQIK